MKKILFHSVVAIFILTGSLVYGQTKPFIIAGQTIRIDNPVTKTEIEINLPATFSKHIQKTMLVFFALPNGNSIAWTKGKKPEPGDDWHYDIQHIAAQAGYLRYVMKDYNLILVYMANELKSWPAWKKQQVDGPAEIRRIVDSVAGMFSAYYPEIVLSSHSGGGSFIFGYLDAVEHIPAQITRIAFMDSDYGYEDSLHTDKLAQWLQSPGHFLSVLAYNDSTVIFNGKPLVSATGGTWYRTRLLQRKLSAFFPFAKTADTSLIHYTALSNRIDIYLKTNEGGKIYHTEQVARNGFIHTILSGTAYQQKSGYVYWGKRIYEDFILP